MIVDSRHYFGNFILLTREERRRNWRLGFFHLSFLYLTLSYSRILVFLYKRLTNILLASVFIANQSCQDEADEVLSSTSISTASSLQHFLADRMFDQITELSINSILGMELPS